MNVLLIQKEWNVKEINAIKKEFKNDPTFELDFFNPTTEPIDDISSIANLIRKCSGDMILVEDCLEGFYYNIYFHSIWDQPVLNLYGGTSEDIPSAFTKVVDKSIRFGKIGNERSIAANIKTDSNKLVIIPMLKASLKKLRLNYIDFKAKE